MNRTDVLIAISIVGVTAFIATFVPINPRWEEGQKVAVSATLVPSEWPPIPTAVPGLAGPITVAVVPTPKDEEGNELWGSWEQSLRRIEIDSAAPLHFQWHTLGHELCHATLGDAGLVNLLEEEAAEALCDAFGSARVQEMRGR